MKSIGTLFLMILFSIVLLCLPAGCSGGDSDDSSTNDLDGQESDDDSVGADDDAALDDIFTDNASFTDDDDDDGYTPPEPSDANGIFVAKTGDDQNPGTMTEPLVTISAGMTRAENDGKFLFAARGEYKEAVTATVSCYGGYEEATWTRGINTYETKIIAPAESDMTVSAPGITIEGFTIKGGLDKDSDWSCGVRIHANDVTLRWNEIRGGVSDSIATSSAGVATFGSKNVLLVENKIYGGASLGFDVDSIGVNIGTGTVTLANNTIQGGNPVSYYGNGASTAVQVMPLGNATMVNNLLLGGDAYFSTGVSSYGSSLLVGNTIIPAESASPEAVVTASFMFLPPGDLTLINNIIMARPSTEGGVSAGVNSYYYNGGQSTITLYNNNFWQISGAPLLAIESVPFNSINDVNGCTWDHCGNAGNNIAVDPLVVGNGDYHLTAASPCIDVGVDPSPWYSGLWANLDFDQDLRPQGSGWDIGMDEFVVMP